MKLYLVGHDYKYAVEQMMLTLFPAERPEYPGEAPEPGGQWAKISLFRGKTWMTAAAEVSVNEARCRRLCRIRTAELTDKTAADRALSHIIKLAFYRA
ncbi:MAG: coproporphyrinogen dehydrogenase HemZ, partial [Clostridia bacterium]|nr:coproporphyrinogen dehydrogenase HemZ [Clostridia bacterium]